MKKILLITLLLLCQLSYGQRPDDSIAKDLHVLISWKFRYERAKAHAEYNPTKYSAKKGKVYDGYLKHLNKIKNNPGIYLNYIERKTNDPELEKGPRWPYNFFDDTLRPVNPEYYYISQRDFYRVVKYSLFDQNRNMLPEKLDGIPGLDRPNDVEKYKLQKFGDVVVDAPKDYMSNDSTVEMNQESRDQIAEMNRLTVKAKRYYNEELKEIIESGQTKIQRSAGNSKTDGTSETASQDQVKAYAQWDKAVTNRSASGLTTTEVPIKYSRQVVMLGKIGMDSVETFPDASILHTIFDRLVIVHGKDGIWGKIVRYHPDETYLDRHNFDASHNYLHMLDKDFSGYLEYLGIGGNRRGLVRVEHAKPVRRYRLRDKANHKHAQPPVKSRIFRDIHADDGAILALGQRKYNYERARFLAEGNPTKYAAEKEKAYNAYLEQIKKIKSDPERYRNYLEGRVKTLNTKEVFDVPYTYISSDLVDKPDYYYITKRDFFRIVKYSLFDRDKDMLPEKLDGIPGLDRLKNIRPFVRKKPKNRPDSAGVSRRHQQNIQKE